VPTPATAVAQAITKLTESVEALTPSAGSSQARWAEIQNQLKNVASGTLTPEQRNKHKTAVRIMENLRASRPDGKGGIAEDKLDDSTKKAYLRALTNFKEVTGNDFTFGTSSFVSNGRTAVHKLLEKVNAPKKQFKIKDAPEISQIIVQKTRSAAEFLSNVTSDRFKDNAVDLIEIDAGSREGYMRSFMSIRASTDTTNSTFVHELAHHIEYETFTKSKTPGSLKRITEFLKKRQGTEPRKARAKEFPNEMVFEDEWVKRGGTNYSSRVYGDATEVITTGAERLFNDPVEFYRKDPEHFEITTRTLLDLW
jgi:hypothetical protein